jgi:LysR family transcriptional regulator, glycine cleavage system transcriptional activator
MRRLPPLTALRAFEAAARQMSFKAAADELGLTPTAISHQIRTLETGCGRLLFRRRPRPIALTEAGLRLFPAIRDGFDRFAAAVAALKDDADPNVLRVTTTNAFAGRWLVPRLPLWCAVRPDLALEVIGTDAVLDLHAGEADLAIRYARTPPNGFAVVELFHDRFFPVCTPKLLSAGPKIRCPAGLARYPLIHAWWPEGDPAAPTWPRWLAMAQGMASDTMPSAGTGGLSFHERLHAIEAVVAGQGIGLCSDVLVGRELASGELVRAADFALPGVRLLPLFSAKPSAPGCDRRLRRLGPLGHLIVRRF